MPYNDDFTVYRPKDTDATADELGHTTTTAKNSLNRKNILINNFNPNNGEISVRSTNKNIIAGNFDVIDSRGSSTSSSSRPSHKTHVEIITKNGATKKPNIIVNNYNPDVILTNSNFHHNTVHQQAHVRNDIVSAAADNSQKFAYDRKITCMLYLQADHTFFQKMGSDDASIEAITRHVQRANVIYKNTGNWFLFGHAQHVLFCIERDAWAFI